MRETVVNDSCTVQPGGPQRVSAQTRNKPRHRSTDGGGCILEDYGDVARWHGPACARTKKYVPATSDRGPAAACREAGGWPDLRLPSGLLTLTKRRDPGALYRSQGLMAGWKHGLRHHSTPPAQ